MKGEEEAERRRSFKLYFAAFREAGILIVVFVVLDGLFYKNGQQIHWLEVGGWFAGGIMLLILGVEFDR